jgi:hypothetical protein
MVANWSVAGLPQLVVGLGNGLIQFYNSKVRYTTYMQMTEAMLAPLRQGRSSIAAWPSGCHLPAFCARRCSVWRIVTGRLEQINL